MCSVSSDSSVVGLPSSLESSIVESRSDGRSEHDGRNVHGVAAEQVDVHSATEAAGAAAAAAWRNEQRRREEEVGWGSSEWWEWAVRHERDRVQISTDA